MIKITFLISITDTLDEGMFELQLRLQTCYMTAEVKGICIKQIGESEAHIVTGQPRSMAPASEAYQRLPAYEAWNSDIQFSPFRMMHPCYESEHEVRHVNEK